MQYFFNNTMKWKIKHAACWQLHESVHIDVEIERKFPLLRSSNQMHLLGRPPHITEVCAGEREHLKRWIRWWILACLRKERSTSENYTIFFLYVRACRSDPPCGVLNISYLNSLYLRLQHWCRINTWQTDSERH